LNQQELLVFINEKLRQNYTTEEIANEFSITTTILFYLLKKRGIAQAPYIIFEEEKVQLGYKSELMNDKRLGELEKVFQLLKNEVDSLKAEIKNKSSNSKESTTRQNFIYFEKHPCASKTNDFNRGFRVNRGIADYFSAFCQRSGLKANVALSQALLDFINSNCTDLDWKNNYETYCVENEFPDILELENKGNSNTIK
jgi:uncharacterized small protein (DUF1192 family)